MPTEQLSVYTKLDIDPYEQHDEFGRHFMVEGNMLSFVGFIPKEGHASRLRYGYGISGNVAAFTKENSEE